jgi:transcriptional regulator with XRE-family HTH domain/tetratricopeptide (TPR) repeat protein
LFGHWVQRRRKLLDITQADLARKVNCSLSMLRKIEREERRPSDQLAGLLADQLAIDDSQRKSFLQLARGKFILDIQNPNQVNDALIPIPGQIAYQEEQASFVSRERELLLLHQHLEGVLDGQGKIIFIAGEAGRGKSSLLHEFARQSLDIWPELIVAGGSSDVFTGIGDPLLPFRDIFRLLAGDVDNSSMRGMINHESASRLARAIPHFTQVLLEFGPHLIDTLIPGRILEACLTHSYPDHPKISEYLLRIQNHRLRQDTFKAQEILQEAFFDEISATLKALAQRQPLMLLLDDLHWIDQSSAALLGHLAKRMKHSPLLIIGSYRPEDLIRQQANDESGRQVQHPLQEVLSESLRIFGYNRINLDDLEPGEELEFINALLNVSANDFSETFKQELAHLTEGHPLFVVELLRDMRERGEVTQLAGGRWKERETLSWESFPARVEGVIEKRIARLPDELRFLLAVGSVQGEIFYAEVIAQIRQFELSQLTHWLNIDLDQRHRLIHEQGVTRIGSVRLSHYRFRHHLFQKYIYDHLAEAERMYLHEAIGNALESLFAGRTDPDDLLATQLARHFREACLSEKASRYLLLAGQNAARVLAFEEAAIHFEQGLSELAILDRIPEIIRLEYDLSLGLARALWHSGRVKEAVTVIQQAIEIARSLNDPHALSHAVLAYEEPRWRLNLDSQLSQQYLREALIALGDEHSGLRVRLLVGLSRSLLASGEKDELRSTVDQALQISRRIEDPLALCDALRIKAHIDRRPESTSERLATIQELISTAKSINDRERLADGFDLYVYDLIELGQIELADQMIEAQRQIAHAMKQPFQMHVAAVFQVMRAIMYGEFEKAELLAEEAATISQQIGIADLDGIYGTHMFTIRREQGRIDEIAPFVKLAIANSPKSSAWRPGLALIYSLVDQRKECQAIFDELGLDGFAFVPQDSLWVATLAYLSEVCAYLNDSVQARTLYELLLPYDRRTVVFGGATVCYGAAARYLGLLAKTMSDWGTAERHFKQAMELDEHIGAWPWLAHSRYEYANMLLERGQSEDWQKAIGLLEGATLAAQTMDMEYLLKKIVKLSSCYDFIPGKIGLK